MEYSIADIYISNTVFHPDIAIGRYRQEKRKKKEE
jgi:hypothetical protein